MKGRRAGRKGESTHRNPGRDRTVCCTLLRYPDVSSSGRSPAQGFWNLFIARWVLLLIVKKSNWIKGHVHQGLPDPGVICSSLRAVLAVVVAPGAWGQTSGEEEEMACTTLCSFIC